MESKYRRWVRKKAEKDQSKAEQEKREAANKDYQEKILRTLEAIEKQTERSNDENTPEKKSDRCWERFGIAGLWVAAATAITAIWITNTDTNNSIIAANRAYIAPGQISFIDLPKEKTEIRLRLNYENIGREPATKMGRWALFGTANIDAFAVPNNDPKLGAKKSAEEIEKAVPDDPCKFADSFRYLGVVFPSRVVQPSTTIFVPPKYMTPDVVSGKNIFIVKGCFVYDTFERRRESRYCYWYWAAAPKFIHETPQFEACAIGNDAN